MAQDSTDTWQVIGALAGGAMLVGAFLPWYQVSILGSTVSNNGIAYGYGLLTLLAGILVGAGFLVSSFTYGTQILTGVVSAIVFVAAALFIGMPLLVLDPTVSGMTDQEAIRLVNPGIGLYLTLVAGIAGFVAAWQRPIDQSGDEETAPEDGNETPGFFTLYWLPGFGK